MSTRSGLCAECPIPGLQSGISRTNVIETATVIETEGAA
jgi:hypothetical protein